MGLTTRGDVDILDDVEDEQSRDEFDVPPLAHDVAFTTDDWLALLKPTGGQSGDSPRKWKRLAAMVATISGIALAIVTFSSGGPIADDAVNLETASGPADDADRNDDEIDGVAVALTPEGVDLELLSSSEEAFLQRVPSSVAAVETTTSTVATTTTVGLIEPVIGPESEWVDAGNGVVVPDVLLRIRFCESTNNYQAAHAVSSARGAYQFLTSSWEWYGHAGRYGAASADKATPAQQDEAAVLTLKRDGTRPWLASRSCWASNSLPSNYATIKPRPQATTTSTTGAASSSSGSSETTQTSSTSASTSSSQPSTSSTDTSSSTTDTSSSTSTTGGSTTSSESALGSTGSDAV